MPCVARVRFVHGEAPWPKQTPRHHERHPDASILLLPTISKELAAEAAEIDGLVHCHQPTLVAPLEELVVAKFGALLRDCLAESDAC